MTSEDVSQLVRITLDKAVRAQRQSRLTSLLAVKPTETEQPERGIKNEK
jgi:hypothetical protein